MHHLRPTAIAGLLLVLVPAAGALSSCGFDYPTDRVNTIAGGINNREGDVDALGIRILASAEGEGRLIGALSNNLREDAALTGVTSPDQRFEAEEFAPVEVPGRGRVNLSTDSNIPLKGTGEQSYTAGDFVKIELTFSNGETIDLEVPVVKNCYQYSSVPTPSAASTGKPKATESAEAEAAEGAEAEGGDARFNCSDEAPTPEGGEGGEE